MAGSLKWFIYTTDAGETFALKGDESNIEAVMGTAGDYLATTTVQNALPKNVKVRRAFYSNGDRSRTISIPVLTQAAYNTIVADHPTITDPIAGSGSLTLIRKTPEMISLPFNVDTGLNDGDAT